MYAIAAFLSPLIGSILYEMHGMRVTFDIVAMFNFAFAMVLMIFNKGSKVSNKKIDSY